MSDQPEPAPGHVRPTRVGVLVLWAVAGLVLGWVFRPLSQRLLDAAPVVTWLQVLTLYLAAAILAAAAWTTWRTVHVRERPMEPHRAVNRLVLAKACAIVGALTAGGYAGYAIGWLGMSAELADQRILRSGLAALAGVLVCVAALALERACRVREEEEDA